MICHTRAINWVYVQINITCFNYFNIPVYVKSYELYRLNVQRLVLIDHVHHAKEIPSHLGMIDRV